MQCQAQGCFPWGITLALDVSLPLAFPSMIGGEVPLVLLLGPTRCEHFSPPSLPISFGFNITFCILVNVR